MPSTASTTIIPSSAQIEPVLSSLVRTHGQPVTPRPVGASSFRPYMTGFTIPMNGHEQPYGMPTSTMTNLHNSTSTFIDPMTTIILPLQGSGSIVDNLGRSTQPLGVVFSAQLPTFTTNSTAVLRKQMDESNYEMVHMLAQHMVKIFNPLIQNTTQNNKKNSQTNQQLETQMTQIADFFGAPQTLVRQPRREWMLENQGLIIREDPMIRAF